MCGGWGGAGVDGDEGGWRETERDETEVRRQKGSKDAEAARRHGAEYAERDTDVD